MTRTHAYRNRRIAITIDVVEQRGNGLSSFSVWVAGGPPLLGNQNRLATTKRYGEIPVATP